MALELFLPVAFVIGYLLGSIPFGLILTRLAGTQDIRSIGSGSIGATNVLRTGRKSLAAATLLLDALKGTVAVVIAGYIAGPNAAMLAGLGAFLGHLFPIWLKFSGGKGVAVYIGVMLGLFWPAALCFACSGWRPPSPPAIPRSRRWSRPSSRRCSCCGSASSHLRRSAAVLTLLLFYAHRENIKRLQSGKESRIGEKA